MDYKYINQLLNKYWEGATTLEEENILRSFFSQKDVPGSLIQFRPLFVYEQEDKEQKRSRRAIRCSTPCNGGRRCTR